MATSETTFKNDLMEQFKARKIHALKLSDRFKSEVLDLELKSPRVPHSIWVELKWATSSREYPQVLKLKLRPGQRRFMRKRQAAGGAAVAWVCVKSSTREEVRMTRDPDAQTTSPEDIIAVRLRGEKWNVDEMIARSV